MAEDTPEAQALAQRLRSAFETQDLSTLAGILDPDVRWGGEEDTPQTCHNRAEVLAWYGDLHARGFRATVVETVVEPHHIFLTLDVTRPDGGTSRNSQVFRIAGGRIVDIRGHEEARTTTTSTSAPATRNSGER
jgi:SnoaL-like domain